MTTTDFSIAIDNDDETLGELSDVSPLLVVFLRHGGCPFCRETLCDLAARRKQIEAAGARIVLVHMMSDQQAAKLFARYHLDDAARVSDPDRKVYQQFELGQGGVAQVMGPGVWWRGFKTTVLGGNLPGIPQGDIFQLPGAFLLHEGKIIRSFRPKTSAEKTDYVEMVQCDENQCT